MPSDFISRKLAQTCFHAFDFAKFIKRPLNLYIVINMHQVGERESDPALCKIRHKCMVWLKRKQKQAGLLQDPPLYVFSFENPKGDDLHVNWVVHIPEEFQEEFRKKLPVWVEKVLGTHPRPSDITVDRVNPHFDKKLAKYILKGTDPHYHAHFHFNDDIEPQGPVHGRRAGASMALNKAARNAAGFKPRRDRDVWKTYSTVHTSPDSQVVALAQLGARLVASRDTATPPL